MVEVGGMPDIMGNLRPNVEAFYRRDDVRIISVHNEHVLSIMSFSTMSMKW